MGAVQIDAPPERTERILVGSAVAFAWHLGQFGASGRTLGSRWPEPPRRKRSVVRRMPIVVTLACCIFGAAACRHQPSAPSQWGPAGQAPPPLLLAQTPLSDGPAIEKIIDSFGLLGAGDEGLTLLLGSARQIPRLRLQSDQGARRWIALGVYRAVRSSGFAERFDSVRLLVDNLHAAAPDAPEAIFCRALLRLALLQERDGKLVAAGIERSIIHDLARDMKVLTAAHAAWDGPGEYDRQRLARDQQRVAALLATLPADTTPTAGQPAVAQPAAAGAVAAPQAATAATAP